MTKSFQHQWFRFLDELPPETLAAVDFLRTVQKFLQECSNLLDEKPFIDYELRKLAVLPAEDYPIEFTLSSEVEIAHLMTIARRNKHIKSISIAQFLRDALEQILLIESDQNCPRCASGGMRIFKNRSNERLVLMCQQCGHGIYRDGTQRASGELVVPTTSDLRGADLIPRKHI